ncbi:MAG TPA: TRAP transporter small permease subunit [Casimicrobiaceae bacterium]|nr:TRAP transporter small permease subunit [Casimicrobiaceae bacterium]
MRALDALVGSIVRAGSWLALPIAALLFMQWPLREVLQRFSREANDLGQICFALYVAIALTAASRRGTHLATDVFAHRYSQRTRRVLLRIVALVAVAPWCIFVLWSGLDIAVRSIRLLEGFPDTFNPGYFVIKGAMCLLAALLLVQTLVDFFAPRRQ